MKFSLKNKIIVLLFVTTLLFVFVIYIAAIYSKSNIIEIEENRNLIRSEKAFLNANTDDVKMLSSALDVFLQNNEFKKIFLTKDRETLYQASLPLFKELKEKYGITHFYYHLPNGTNFLRVHDKLTFKDTITRSSFIEAEQSKDIGVGLELGKTAFALRVVKPYIYNGEIVGYVEFGEEINHFLNIVKNQTENEMGIMIKKQYLSRNDWKISREKSGLKDNWDDFGEYILVNSTLNDQNKYNQALKYCFTDKNANEILSLKDKKYFNNILSNNFNSACGAFPVYDNENKIVGSIFILSDLSSINSFYNRVRIILFVIIFVFAILGMATYYFIMSVFIIKPITKIRNIALEISKGNFSQKSNIKTKDEIGDLSKSFDNMVKAVKDSQESIKTQVENQTKEIKEKQIFLEEQQKAVLNILEDVEEEKSKTEALLAGIGEGVIATDINANIIFINNVAQDLIKWSAKEVIGMSIYQVLPVYDEKEKLIIEENRPFHLALELNQKVFVYPQDGYYYSTKNGKKFPVTVSVTPVVFDNKLIGAINVFRDITREKQIDKAKTEFVSLASHQLRTPLSAIGWYTEMLLAGDAGKITKAQKQYLEEVYKSNKRMVDLVNSLLNVSRIDLGTFAIVPEIADLTEIADSILLELTPMIKTKKTKIEKKYEKDLPKIKVDQKLTRIIFQNLLSNAVKYTPEKGNILLSIEKNNENVLIKVQDDGYGIPENEHQRIFEKLFRADNIREKETDGTGLGLYIVKAILEQSGGKIYFESKLDKGTTFFVEIPLFGMKKKDGTKDLS